MFINNLAYEASAGSGKTFMLVVRYLSLLFKGAEPSKILALTFTNKAASEMSQRVVETLEELASRGELEEIVKVTELSREEILSQRARVLDSFLNASTKIMTIDSFFTQILRKFSLYASLMPDFTTFAAQHELKLLSRFLKEVTVANQRKSLIELSLSSKKRLSDLFALLDELYIKQEELVNIEFTQVETKGFEDEAMLALAELQKLVQNCPKASATLQKAVVAKDFAELKRKSWLTQGSLEYWVFKKCFTLEMNRYLHIIQEALQNHYRAKESNFFYALTSLVAIYKKSKKALYIDEGELSFSDVTALVYDILHHLNDSEFLYFRLDAHIEHILLDEFQDTSIVQYEILKPLIKEISSGAGIFESGSLFFVGDVKQSIYRFRGGVSALFGEVSRQNNTYVDKLLTNYRSQKEVVSFVNSAFQGKITNYTPQLVRKEADGGYVSVQESETLIEDALVRVEELVALGADLNEIAILCATNGDGEAVKMALQEAHIEVVTETTTKLINQKSIRALLEYLKYLYFKEEIYRYNFFALIESEIGVICPVDLSRVRLFDVIKNAIEHYKLFSDDFHLIRFLNAVGRYSDIEALLFEYERLDSSAAASDLQGVRVLTIHKSKGLEYTHVIVMDRLKKEPNARSPIIYEYDGIVLQNIYLRSSKREELDSIYARALQKEKKLIQEDTLNALYVAFTRACENLFIIAKPKESAFSLLDLELGERGRLTLTQEKKESKKESLSIEYKELYYGTQSDILAMQQEQESDIQAINFGLAMHYMLEMLSSFTPDKLHNAKNMMINKYGFILLESEIEEISRRVERLLGDAQFLKLTQGICYKEKPLRYENSLRYIDLLVEDEAGGYRVIDYKSSQLHAKEHYKQVKLYVEIVERISAKKVDGYICYLLEDRVEIERV